MAQQPEFTVYYNGLTTVHGAHLLAVGWTNEGGWKPTLEEQNASTRFRLSFESNGDGHTQVITPFQICVEASRDPRSVHVTDDHGEHQVQMNGLIPVPSGGNGPSEWVQSGE